jgi:hypothetical protein
MTYFYPFPRLPLELREQIWKEIVEQRTVDVRIVHKGPERQPHIVSSTPIPSTLQSCQEARNQGLYQRVPIEVDTRHGIERRYVWLNWDIDILDIGTSYFSYFKSIASSIKRLKFERENGDEYFYHKESMYLQKFANAEEIHVVCADGFWMWGGALYDHPWPCAHENIFFIDPIEGRVTKGLELEKIYRAILKEWRLAETSVAYSSDDELNS